MKLGIKYLIVLSIVIGGGINSAMAQQNVNKAAIFDGEIVNLEGQSDLYAYSNTYSVNEEGKVSAQVLSFYENGDLKEMGKLIDGKKHGVWIKYSDTGAKVAQAEYNLGKKDGKWLIWDEEGRLRMEYQFEDGKRVGTWTMYDENGNLVKSSKYD